MKTQSVEVLNEADRQQRIINWMLFKQEQGFVLRYIEGEWNVGDPIWNRPNSYTFALNGGQYVRPMFEEMLFDEFHLGALNIGENFYIRCVDCEVSWAGDEPCFVCGNPGRDDVFRWKFTTDASDGPFSIDRVRDTSDGVFNLNVQTFLVESQITTWFETRVRMDMENRIGELLEELDLPVPNDMRNRPRRVVEDEPPPERVIINEIEIPAHFDVHTNPQYTHDLGDNIHIAADLGNVRRQIEERGWPSSRPVWIR